MMTKYVLISYSAFSILLFCKAIVYNMCSVLELIYVHNYRSLKNVVYTCRNTKILYKNTDHHTY